ncbi:MAG: TetR family transcriptional regulator C-terminal domain-containing protein [Planctomycetes bacterium]|nr:TetR family transcriptional regulator C-terminal domain-containing protein [Planctomycetota bacterium]
MPRPSNTDERRQEIVLALARVMATRGYAGASVLRIARAAGLAPGLIHYHFSTKQEILLGLVDHLRRVVRARYERRISAAKKLTPKTKLKAYIEAHVSLGGDADSAAMACWVTIGAEALRTPEVRAVYAGALEEERILLQALLRDVLTESGRSPAKARSLAAALLSALQGAYQLGSAVPGVIPPGEASPLLKRMAEGLIEAQPLRR